MSILEGGFFLLCCLALALAWALAHTSRELQDACKRESALQDRLNLVSLPANFAFGDITQVAIRLQSAERTLLIEFASSYGLHNFNDWVCKMRDRAKQLPNKPF